MQYAPCMYIVRDTLMVMVVVVMCFR